jgi:hypothetical protein
MAAFDPQVYGPVFAPLLAVDRRRALNEGKRSVAERAALGPMSTKIAFAHAGRTVADRDMALCSIAGVWLLHDELDESHTITQSIKSDSGSYWHAIMHRREGDFSNAKYWFRHVGEHPTFDALAVRVAELAAKHGQTAAMSRLAPQGAWQPFAFVDLCQQALREGGPLAEFCLDVQQAEWELLFDHCYRAAVGK